MRKLRTWQMQNDFPYIMLNGPCLERGLWWYLFERNDGVRHIASAVVIDGKRRWVGDDTVNFVTPLEELIEEYWPMAIESAQCYGFPAADQVPWEIHSIENETAYRTALESYKAEL